MNLGDFAVSMGKEKRGHSKYLGQTLLFQGNLLNHSRNHLATHWVLR